MPPARGARGWERRARKEAVDGGKKIAVYPSAICVALLLFVVPRFGSESDYKFLHSLRPHPTWTCVNCLDGAMDKDAGRKECAVTHLFF